MAAVPIWIVPRSITPRLGSCKYPGRFDPHVPFWNDNSGPDCRNGKLAIEFATVPAATAWKRRSAVLNPDQLLFASPFGALLMLENSGASAAGVIATARRGRHDLFQRHAGTIGAP